MRNSRRLAVLSCLFVLMALAPAPQAGAQSLDPEFSMSFAPDTIGPGSTTTLIYLIDNTASHAAVEPLSFSDILPAAISIASPANASTTCHAAGDIGPTLRVFGASGTIAFNDAQLGANSSCAVTVDVTSSTEGTHTNDGPSLSWGGGNPVGSLSADLTVTAVLPGFSKDFHPPAIYTGGRSTLTLTIDNSANPGAVTEANFTDQLPVGMMITDPSNATTDCGTATLPPTLTAAPGTGVISLSALGTVNFPVVAAQGTCTVAVEVVATGVGTLLNSSGELVTENGSAGKATATLTVRQSELLIVKEFIDDPIPPGGTATLEISISNFNRSATAREVAFVDVFPTHVALADPANASSDCGGSITAADGGTRVRLTGGAIAPESSCTISVDVTGAESGAHRNRTGRVSGTIAGEAVTGNTATDELFVVAAPFLTKEFIDDPVAAGDPATLRFTITDTTTSGGSTDIEFTDELTDASGDGGQASGFLPFPVSVTPPADPCGAGSTLSLVSVGTDRQGLSLEGGFLSPGGTCSFNVLVDIPAGFPGGTYTNTTGEITATVAAATVTGAPATDDLVVVAGPELDKEFLDDPISPGDPVTLEFTLTHSEFAPTRATDITFTDDLGFVAGLTALDLPKANICGRDSAFTESGGSLTLTGGKLMPGASCTFSATLQSSAATPSGIHTNTTSDVGATVGGKQVTELPASDDLIVTELSLTKQFTDDPVLPGGTATLEFTITNDSPTDSATGIGFTDYLGGTLPGLTPSAGELPLATGCGNSLPDIGDTLAFTGGSAPAGGGCTFSLTVDVPPGAVPGIHRNRTSAMAATIGGSPAELPGAFDDLVVAPLPTVDLQLRFTPEAVAPGGQVTLRHRMTNTSITHGITGIAFTNALPAGLSASGAPIPACGGTLTGTTTLTLTGGQLGPGEDCPFTIVLGVPGATNPDTYVDTTSAITGVSDTTLPIGGAAGTAELVVTDDALVITKGFTGGPAMAGAPTTLEFTVQNTGATTVNGIGFTDDLTAMLPGTVTVGLPASAPCGAGSALASRSNDTVVKLLAGSLAPRASCTFSVDIVVPGSAEPGSYTNTTGAVTGEADGPVDGLPAIADLVVTELRDRPSCNGALATRVGTQGDDIIIGTAGVDVIVAKAGDDTIDGRGGDDIVCAGPGDDIVYGRAGDDVIFGGTGNDVIKGGAGTDELIGLGGNDEIHGGDGDDTLKGGPGADMLNGDAGNDQLLGHSGPDRLDGGPGNDIVSGWGKDDWLSGGNGADRIRGGPGDDLIMGGNGDDRILGHGGADTIGGDAGDDIVNGGLGDDVIRGGADNDRLLGTVHNDTIYGETGRDVLNGGPGVNHLDGGLGHDRCTIDAVNIRCEVLV